jgi:hypothetical protein
VPKVPIVKGLPLREPGLVRASARSAFTTLDKETMTMGKLLSACALMVALGLVYASDASAQVVNLRATLSGGEEAPNLVLTGAVGSADVSVDLASRDISVTLRVFNLATGTVAGHIHVGAKGVAGPVVLDFPIVTGQTGDFNQTFRLGLSGFHPRPEIGINTLDDVIQAITGGNAYANVHTSQNPGGEIRGQLVIVN